MGNINETDSVLRAIGIIQVFLITMSIIVVVYGIIYLIKNIFTKATTDAEKADKIKENIIIIISIFIAVLVFLLAIVPSKFKWLF